MSRYQEVYTVNVERVQVGTETVEISDPTAPTITVDRPVYEWRCPESLAA
jgi:hypothetical protein